MITSISVDGFKTLSNFSLDLKPGLNVLVGPNGSGKTNIISFFEFLARLVDRDPSDATSHLGGAGAVFRRVKDTYQPAVTATVSGCYLVDNDRYPFSGQKTEKSQQALYAMYEYGFTVLFSHELESIVFSKQLFRFKHAGKFVPPPRSGANVDAGWDLDVEMVLQQDLSVKTKVRQLHADVVPYFPFFRSTKDRDVSSDLQDLFSRVTSPSTAIPALFARFTPAMSELLDDLAGGQTYNIIPSRVKILEDSAKPPGIGSDGSGLSSTLYSLRQRQVSDFSRMWGIYTPSGRTALKRPSLDTLKGYFQLANSSIQDVEVTNDSFNNQLRVSLVIKNGDYDARVPLSLMSDGTLKWLTLLTAALTATSVFSIEEPENYLHPAMQGQFINIIREILFTERKYACTLMTTHSETLLNHCKPNELVIVSLKDGATVSLRCKHEREISAEIAKTGFGLGYYYIAGALQDE